MPLRELEQEGAGFRGVVVTAIGFKDLIADVSADIGLPVVTDPKIAGSHSFAGG